MNSDMRQIVNSIMNMYNTQPLTRTERKVESRTINGVNVNADVYEADNAVFVLVELAGVEKDSITIDVFNNKLVVIAEKKKSYSAEPSVRQIEYGQIRRTINLPFCVTRRETVSSNFENGLLKIKIDRLVEEQNRFSLRV